MPRPRVIVGIGEALQGEFAQDLSPAGLAATVPIWARRMGHRGVAISRLGQDGTAAALIASLRTAEVDVSHLQSDPDRATGRLRGRRLDDRTTMSLDREAAFDFLQWDYDLSDVAQEADAVVFGRIGCRRMQTASTIKQFLGECRGAVRVLDLIAPPGVEAPLPSALTIAAMEFVDAVAVDLATLHALLPGSTGGGQGGASSSSPPWDQTARELMRLAGLGLVMLIEPGKGLAVVTPKRTQTGDPVEAQQSHPAGVVALLHGLLSGWDMPATVRLATRVARQAIEHPDDPIPAPWMQQP